MENGEQRLAPQNQRSRTERLEISGSDSGSTNRRPSSSWASFSSAAKPAGVICRSKGSLGTTSCGRICKPSNGNCEGGGTSQSQSARRAAIATRCTFAILPNCPASCAAAGLQTRIIFVSLNCELSDVRSATNSQSRFAACTTVPFIALATSGHGGKRTGSTRSKWHARFGRRPENPQINRP
jgi:hypothetical protein